MFRFLHRLLDFCAVNTCAVIGHQTPKCVPIWDDYLYYSDIVGYRHICPRCGVDLK